MKYDWFSYVTMTTLALGSEPLTLGEQFTLDTLIVALIGAINIQCISNVTYEKYS